MKFCGDYHLHTGVSDGRSDISAHVEAARRRGLSQIAVSDHSFSTFMYHATKKKLEKQKAEIEKLSDCGIKIFQGLEANIIGGALDAPHSVIRNIDVLTIGFHRFITPSKMNGESKFLLVNGFGGARAKEKLICKNTEAYISVLENYPVDIIAHLGHRAPVDTVKVCECAARHNVYLELNAKHLDALENTIDEALSTDVNFIVGTDSHSAKTTGDFSAVEKFIVRRGIPACRVFGIDGNMPVFKDKGEWKYGSNV